VDESFLKTSDKCVDALLYGDERSDDGSIVDVFDWTVFRDTLFERELGYPLTIVGYSRSTC
jgi:hypothetical protein